MKIHLPEKEQKEGIKSHSGRGGLKVTGGARRGNI